MGSRMFTLHVPEATFARCTVHRRSGGKSIAGGYLHSNAGVFSRSRGLGRQGRDTDASNGEVLAEGECWDQLAALSWNESAVKACQEKSDVASAVVIRGR